METIRTLVVDHRTLIRDGISRLLMGLPGLEVVDEAKDAQEAVEILRSSPVDVVLVDIELPEDAGTDKLVLRLREASPGTHVLILTNSIDPAAIHAAFRGGAAGYVLKSISLEDLADAIQSAHRGVPVLSPEVTRALIHQVAEPLDRFRKLTRRERAVLDSIAHGYSNARIARELAISLSTVQFHISNILFKLNVHNRTEAARLAIHHVQISGNEQSDALDAAHRNDPLPGT